MDVIVDGANFPIGSEPGTAAEALAAVSDALRGEGRAMVAVKVDDSPVRPDDLTTSLGDRPLQSVARIEVESKDIPALVEECLNELEQHVPELPGICRQLAAVFQSAQPEEGFEPFERLARIWEEIKRRQALAASVLEISLDEMTIGGVPAAKQLKELNDFLHEAADALDANDCVTLGDLLEYELAPRAEAEAEVVALLQEQAQQRFG